MKVEVKIKIYLEDEKSNDLVRVEIKLLLVTTSPNDYIDVHTMDSKYTHHIETRFDKNSKMERFEKLKTEVKSLLPIINTRGLEVVINDTETDANWDKINNLKADDVLVELYEYLKDRSTEDKVSFYSLIIEELNDMIAMGTCPQGRTTRIYQIYTAMTDIVNPG